MAQFDNFKDFQLREESIDGGKTLTLKMLRTGFLIGLAAAVLAVALTAGYDQYHTQVYQMLFPPKVVVYTNSSVYTIGVDGSVYALQATNGAIRWKSRNQFIGLSGGSVIGVAEHTVAAYATNGAIIGLNVANGAIRWTYTAGGLANFQPIVSGNTIIAAETSSQVTNGQQIFSLAALDIGTGKTLWQEKLPYYLDFFGMANGAVTIVMEQEIPNNFGTYAPNQQQVYIIESINLANGAQVWKNIVKDSPFSTASAMLAGTQFLLIYSQDLFIIIHLTNGAITLQKQLQNQTGYMQNDNYVLIGASATAIYMLLSISVYNNNTYGYTSSSFAQKINTTGKLLWQASIGQSLMYFVNDPSVQYTYANLTNYNSPTSYTSTSTPIDMFDQSTGKLTYTFPYYFGTYTNNFPKEEMLTNSTYLQVIQYDSFGVYNLQTGAELWSKYILGSYQNMPMEVEQYMFLSNVIDKTNYYIEYIATQTGKVLWTSGIHIPTYGIPYLGASV